MPDAFSAFFRSEVYVPGAMHGPLQALRFAAKEAFDVRGWTTSAGNPAWLFSHGPAERTAAAVQTLLNAGATLTGKTHTDELMFGLNGQNAHYGTPVNPLAADRIPGGSSSGSAVAVASGMVDFALGTDTGGSIRAPASYCGLYGFRPTHGRIDTAGMVPLAPSFDTVGWLTSSPSLLAQVGRVLMGESDTFASFREESAPTIYFSQEAVQLLDPSLQAAYQPLWNDLSAQAVQAQWKQVAPGPLTEGKEIFRFVQGWEIRQALGSWIAAHQPRFGPGVRERFDWVLQLREKDVAPYLEKREYWRRHLRQVLEEGALIALPTVPGIAPYCEEPLDAINAFRDRVLQLTCLAGIAGVPQISLPWGRFHDLPLGVSLIAAPGQDAQLWHWAQKWQEFCDKGGLTRASSASPMV